MGNDHSTAKMGPEGQPTEETSEALIAAHNRAIGDPSDPRYVSRPTSAPREWLELQESISRVQKDPEWIYHELLYDFSPYIPHIHDPPGHDPNDRAPMYAYFDDVFGPSGDLTDSARRPSEDLVESTGPSSRDLAESTGRPSQDLADVIPPQSNKPVTRRDTAQNPGKHNRKYATLLKGRPPVNIRPPLNIDISIVEILTFFPSWTRIPLVVLRAVRNGFTRQELAELLLRSVHPLTTENIKRESERVQQHMRTAGLLEAGIKSWDIKSYKQTAGVQNDLTANQWKLASDYPGGCTPKGETEWKDMELADIAKSVPDQNWPKGNDRLLLTRCLEYAANRSWSELDTTHWDVIIRNVLGYVAIPPAPTGHNVNRDTVAHSRLFPGA